jgi:hypothetical protein
MNLDSLKSWLDAYGRAWETRNPEAAGALFTQDASYHETPYDEPMRGRSAIVEYWSHVPRTQDDVHFSHDIIALTGEVAIAHWSTSFLRIPSNAKVKLDGIFLLTFDEQNLCKSLREWWMRNES